MCRMRLNCFTSHVASIHYSITKVCERSFSLRSVVRLQCSEFVRGTIPGLEVWCVHRFYKSLCMRQVARSLDRLESVSNFAEFVRAFTEFGGGMVELARLTAERRADLRDERRRAQVAAARNVLERSTLMLLTSSKVFCEFIQTY